MAAVIQFRGFGVSGEHIARNAPSCRLNSLVLPPVA